MTSTPYRPYIEPLVKELTSRGTRSALSLLGIGNPALRQTLARQLDAPPGEGLLADPVFEPTFGWTESGTSMGELSGNLLHMSLVEAMAKPPSQLAEDYTFPHDRAPFSHQLEAWQLLSGDEPRSLVVTSGTGSGKTECFLVPILDRLARQSEREGALQGVRALFIYPLNALIASQQNRLDAWTDRFAGKLRYCLYTGNLPDQAKPNAKAYQGQVVDRKTLRGDPPPLLVTNATMLEYMLIRKEDQPILAKSQGKLEWIVLDEAHTHIGSQAAEMALLLRRVMLAFGVSPQNVRFVATSATFGDNPETTRQLKKFLANMAGVSTDQVYVVHGKRKVPDLPEVTAPAAMPSLEELKAIDCEHEASADRYRALAAHPTACALRGRFVDGGNVRVRTLSRLVEEMGSRGLDRQAVLHWLDLLSGTRNPEDGSPFLPLRIHLFQNVLSGVYACVDPACSARQDSLDPADWAYGKLYTAERTACDCGAPVLPVAACKACNTVHLQGVVSEEYKLVAPRRMQDDDFELESVEATEESGQDEPSGQRDQMLSRLKDTPALVVARAYEGRAGQAWLDRTTHALRGGEAADSSIRLFMYQSEHQQSCPACESKAERSLLMRRLALGAAFTMGVAVNTLLEFCPDDKSPQSKPYRGRKMITFTDSRQGTARLAVKLQQDSERSYVRGLVYHHLLQAGQSKGALTAEEASMLSTLAPMAAAGGLQGDLQAIYQRLQAKEAAGSVPELDWNALGEKLAGDHDVRTGLLDYYHQQAPELFPRDSGASRLARLFMFREFARRPKNQNSLESMGLVSVQYPALQQVTAVPQGWRLGVDVWRDYLKVLLDFHVRENSFISADEDLARLFGARIRPKWLLSPESKETGDSRHQHWPQFNPESRQPARAVALLAKLHAWEDVAIHRDEIDLWLRQAWAELCKLGLLVKSNDGYRLDFGRTCLRLISHAGICPVTRRFLDTPLNGLTPYTPPKAPDAVSRVEMARIPLYGHAFGEGEDDQTRISAARVWLAEEAEVCALRERGLWSDLHDRVIEGGAWFRCAEHSAQQPRSRLEEYESLFRSGRINLMSCSTTMEMGVDIGGISVVAMNNVPPHPANYLQRAGRAGRRREGRAVALTVCKNTPHDQGVFSQPDWPFVSQIRVPDVSLQSPELVQRHLNAWLLAHWFSHHLPPGEMKTTNCAAFFLANDVPSLAKRFGMWCDHPESNLDASLRSGLSALTKRTPLERQPAETLVRQAGKAMQEMAKSWLQRYQGMVQQRDVFKGDNEQANVAFRALNLQIKRIEDEYLLSELANGRFLPGYGFPTDVVSFDNRTRSTMPPPSQNRREDNRGRYQDLPSRDRVTALREYAPGNSIVMDGLVFRSGGITLNWHVPASMEDAREIQLFKYAWRCRHCGASGNSLTGKPDCCEQCGTALKPEDVPLYLVPSGFAVDFFDPEPHNDISEQVYIPVQRPWLSLNAPWLALANPAAGRFRSSNKAHLFSHSSGVAGKGYAVCLECGRAESMLSIPDTKATVNEQYLPAIFRSKSAHRRLRGNKGPDQSRVCPGSDSPWKIKTNVHLGHDSVGDALEVMLAYPEGGWLNDDVAAYSIAVAMRRAIARELGVLEEELGCATTPIRHDGQEVRAIQVYDQRSGGYSAMAAPLLHTAGFWRQVRDALGCASACPNACQHCLLGFDTRFEADRLDRHRALAVLTEAWISQLALPEAVRPFGEDTVPESLPLEQAWSLALEGHIARARIYLQGSTAAWDLPAAHRLQRLLLGLAVQSLPVELLAAEGTLARLGEVDRFKLAEWVGATGAVYGELPAAQMGLQGSSCLPVCALQGEHGWTIWASDDTALALPNAGWGELPDGALLVRGRGDGAVQAFLVPASDIRPAGGDSDVSLSTELDGTTLGFGERFWSLLRTASPGLAALLDNEANPLQKVSYSDRYLRNPLAVSLLVDLIYALTQTACGSNRFDIEVVSQTFANIRQNYGRWWDDWDNHVDRDSVLQRVLLDCGLTARVCSADAGQIEHARILELHFESGQQLRLRLDQGVSFWRQQHSHHQPRFGFAQPVTEQSASLLQPALKVAAPEGLHSHVFIKL